MNILFVMQCPLRAGVDQEDYARLMQHADIPSDDRYKHVVTLYAHKSFYKFRKTIRNLQHLGAKIFNEVHIYTIHLIVVYLESVCVC